MRHALSRLKLALCAGLAVLAGGCAGGSRQYPMPRSIEFDAATGAWTIATEGKATIDQLPESLAVFSTHEGKRVEGVWLIEGTEAFKRQSVAEKRGFRPSPQSYMLLADLPHFVESHGRSWRIRFIDKTLSGYGGTWKDIGPLRMEVPVRRPGANAPHDSFIEREGKSA